MKLKPGTNIPYSDEELVDFSIAKLSRIFSQGMHHFYTRHVKQVLTELVEDVKIHNRLNNNIAQEVRDVFNT